MSTLRSLALALVLSDAVRDARRRGHRLVRGRRRVITCVHQLDDPYGLLLLQVVEQLAARADADLRVIVLPSPSEAHVPDPARLAAWSLRDAAGLAAQHGLEFPASARSPTPAQLAAAQLEALELPADADQLARLRQISTALLCGELQATAGASERVAARLAANAAEVHRLGHYQGGMLYYEGEWYWGIDRLSLLEQRLRDEGVELPPTLDVDARPCVQAGRLWGASLPSRGQPRPELELFYSLRSPYSYLALERTIALAERRQVSLRIRLVLPMVMRGLAVPLVKRLYIAHDAKRLAQQLGLPFGRIADPLGVGVERCMAVAHIAAQQGRLPEFLRSAAAAVWAEGIDVASDAGLRRVAARAGLDENQALSCARTAASRERSAERERDAGDKASWREVVEDNRAALLGMGLWGVPCVRYGELTLWGQDRLAVLDVALAAQLAGSMP